MTQVKIPFTYFRSCTDQKPIPSELFQTIRYYINDEHYQGILQEIAAIPDKKERDKRKISSLPCFCASALLENGGAEKNIKQALPMLFIDIDKFKSYEEAIKALNAIRSKYGNYLVYSTLSISRKGLHLIFKLAHSDKHYAYWKQLQEMFIREFNLTVDEQAQGVVHKTILSCFKDCAELNEFAESLQIEDQYLHITKRFNKKAKEASLVPIESIVKEVENSGLTFTESSRHAFLLEITYRCNHYGIEEEKLSEFLNEKYQLSSFQEHSKIVEDIYTRYSDQFGVKQKSCKSDGDKVSKFEKAMKFLSQYGFRYNEINEWPEIDEGDGEGFKPLCTRKQNTLLVRLGLADAYLSKSDLLSLLNSDYSKHFHAFRDYLDNIPKYTGERDYIRELAETVEVIFPDKETWVENLRKFLTGVVGCMYVDEVVNHLMLLFSGEQSAGKTLWFNRLYPEKLAQYVYSGTIDPYNKDAQIYLSECWFIFMDEFDAIRSRDIPALKEMITKKRVHVRRVWEHRSVDLPRRASFGGTINDAAFLTDSTGARRFLVTEVGKCNHTHSVDMDMVFAQAFHLFKSGFRYYLNDDEVQKLNVNNEKFRTVTVEEGFLTDCFGRPGETEGEEIFLTPTQILHSIQRIMKVPFVDNLKAVGIGKALQRHGFERVKKGVYGYLVVRKLPDPKDEVEEIIVSPEHIIEKYSSDLRVIHPENNWSSPEAFFQYLNSKEFMDSIITPKKPHLYA